MTTSNRLGITELASTQNDRSVTVNEAIAKLEAGATFFAANSVLDTGPAGTPSNVDGDLYIVGMGATGDWAGHDYEIAIFYNEAWLFLPSIEGMTAYAQDEDIFYKFDGYEWLPIYQAYDIQVAFSGTPTDSDQLLGKHVAVRTIYFPANFSGSYGHVGQNPSITYEIDAQVDSVSIGSISISTSGVFTFTTTSSEAKTVTPGQRIEFYAPTGSPSDWTIADIAATLYGSAVL